MLWIHLEVGMLLHRTVILKTSPFLDLIAILLQDLTFLQKPIETLVAPAREPELLRWLRPFLALVVTKISFAASAC